MCHWNAHYKLITETLELSEGATLSGFYMSHQGMAMEPYYILRVTDEGCFMKITSEEPNGYKMTEDGEEPTKINGEGGLDSEREKSYFRFVNTVNDCEHASLVTVDETIVEQLENMVALLAYEKNPETCFSMLDALRGPEPLSAYGKSFIKDRLERKEYKVKSFFHGATVQNGYEPIAPYTITVTDNPTSFAEENWATVYVKSAGADSERGIKLRKKPSTGQWFLNDLLCLSDIKVPASADPWA